MQKTADIIIIGAGIAGLVCALEALKTGKKVLIIDAQSRERLGGLARSAFGGMALVGTPQQKAKGIIDTPEIAYQNWCSFAEFGHHDYWPKAWAKHYVEHSVSEVYDYVKKLGMNFLPAVNWVERGLYVPGNSVPRYHILWGASLRLIHQLDKALKAFEDYQLSYIFKTKVNQLISSGRRVVGCLANKGQDNEATFYADHVVIACGGFTGNLDKVREYWPKDWGKPPQNLLNGAHPDNDGEMHIEVEKQGGVFSNRENMWHYAAGIPATQPQFNHHGLSLIPCKSALWLDHLGNRIGPEPLVTGFDTYHMCRQISQLQLPHTWQVLNLRIALKELAISGCEHNPSIRDRKLITLLKEIVGGNQQLVTQMLRESDNFVIADDLQALCAKMNLLTPEHNIVYENLLNTVDQYDKMLKRNPKLWNDDQIRRILQIRYWFTDKLRTCYPKPIQAAPPLIAIKLNLITRKSLGGIKTDLNSRVLDHQDKPIDGLLAIGEAAGFGGGGASGKRSLEGTFLSGCILTARQAARFVS